MLLKRQGAPALTRSFYERTLTMREASLGPQHSDFNVPLFNLARLLEQQCDFSAALPLFERILAINECTFGVIIGACAFQVPLQRLQLVAYRRASCRCELTGELGYRMQAQQ